MGNVNHFNVLGSYLDDESFDKNLAEINAIVKQKNNDGLSFSKIDRLIYLHEMSAISYRRLLQNYELKDNEEAKLFYKRNTSVNPNELNTLSDLPIFVANFATDYGKVLYIKTPFTFRRGMKESFNLATYLNASLSKDFDHRTLDISHLGEKKIVYAIRVAEKFNSAKHCDNDNLELSEMINVIFSHLVSSDNALKMTMVSEFLESSDKSLQGLHLVIAPYNLPIMKAKDLLNFIQSKITN